MAVEDLILNPEVLGGSFIFMMVGYVIAFAIQVYLIYLNWKQSEVKNQMQELINEVKEIKSILEKKKK